MLQRNQDGDSNSVQKRDSECHSDTEEQKPSSPCCASIQPSCFHSRRIFLMSSILLPNLNNSVLIILKTLMWPRKQIIQIFINPDMRNWTTIIRQYLGVYWWFSLLITVFWVFKALIVILPPRRPTACGDALSPSTALNTRFSYFLKITPIQLRATASEQMFGVYRTGK